MRDYIVTIDEDDAELMHYGVVGMKWHHRKAVSYAAKGNMKKANAHLEKNKRNVDKYRNIAQTEAEKIAKMYKDKKYNVHIDSNYGVNDGFNIARTELGRTAAKKVKNYSKYNSVSKNDIEKYKKGRRKAALIGLGTAAVGGFASAAALEIGYRKMDKKFSSHRYGASESMGVARNNKYRAGKMHTDTNNKRSSALSYTLHGGKNPNTGARNFYNNVPEFNNYRNAYHNTKDLDNLSAFSSVRRKKK